MENTDNIVIIYNPNVGQHRKKFLERAIKILESNETTYLFLNYSNETMYLFVKHI